MMLGAFEDSELEPNEMQEVAFHLARCESCTSILADYSTLGRDLRTITIAPNLAGFSNAVVTRIDRLPQPLTARVARFFRRQTESLGASLAWGGAVAVAAILTAIVMTPYAAQFARHNAASTTIASAKTSPALASNQLASNDPTMKDSDSEADISRLESPTNSVAVWSEPRRGTTVIWLPDQQ